MGTECFSLRLEKKGGGGDTRRDAITQHYVLFLSLKFRRDEKNIRHASRRTEGQSPIFTQQAPCQVRGGDMTIFGTWKQLSVGNTLTVLQQSYFNTRSPLNMSSLLEFTGSKKFLCSDCDTIKCTSISL